MNLYIELQFIEGKYLISCVDCLCDKHNYLPTCCNNKTGLGMPHLSSSVAGQGGYPGYVEGH